MLTTPSAESGPIKVHRHLTLFQTISSQVGHSLACAWKTTRMKFPAYIGPQNCGRMLLPPAMRSSPGPRCKLSEPPPFFPLKYPLLSSSHPHHLVIHLQPDMKLSHCWLLKNRVGKGENRTFTVRNLANMTFTK